MTGKELVELALKRLNYTDVSGAVDVEQNTDLMRRGADAVEYVVTDLLHVMGEKPVVIDSIDKDLPLPDDVCVRVAVWGVGMMLAASESDGDNQSYFAAHYNQLRGSVSRKTERLDVLPRPAL